MIFYHKKDKMNNIEITILIGIFSIILNEFNTYYELNPYTFIIFINLCGLYHLLSNISINITVRYRD